MSAKSKRDLLMAELKSSFQSQAPLAPPETEIAGSDAINTETEPPTDVASDSSGTSPESSKKNPGRSSNKRATAKPSPSRSSPPVASGKQTAFWLDDEDRAILHDMGMQLYSQGIKPSHNLVVRAALRMVPKDHRFFEKVKELLDQDGRKVRHR